MNNETREYFENRPYAGTIILEKEFDEDRDGKWYTTFVREGFYSREICFRREAEAKKAIKKWLKSNGVFTVDFNDAVESGENGKYKVYIRVIPGKKLGNALIKYGFKEVG